jgi:hypothetical protein
MMKKKELKIKDELTEFLLYTTPNGKVKVEIFFHNENIWLTQKRMAELFGVNVPAISKHLKNIFDSGELDENSVISILETTAEDGKNYQTKYYNLDAEKDFMGLKTWKSAPVGRIIKSDTNIAKNYLKENEIKKLERTVSGFFDYVENIIENRISFTMEEFAINFKG